MLVGGRYWEEQRERKQWLELYERRIKKLKNPYPYVTSNIYGGYLFFSQLLSTCWLLSANEKKTNVSNNNIIIENYGLSIELCCTSA